MLMKLLGQRLRNRRLGHKVPHGSLSDHKGGKLSLTDADSMHLPKASVSATVTVKCTKYRGHCAGSLLINLVSNRGEMVRQIQAGR